MKITFFVLVSLINNAFGEECDSCCIPDVEKYSNCYKECLTECTVFCNIGTEFGKQGNSYWEFTGNEMDFLKAPYTINLNITLEFSTTEPNGLILFGGNDMTLSDTAAGLDFVSLIIKDGYVSAHLATIIDSGVATTVSTDKYNDGNFHTASIKQTGDFIDLCVDHKCTQGSNRRKMSAGWYSNNGLFWVGGVPNSIEAQAFISLTASNIGVTNISGFKGCIHNIVVDGVNITSPAIKFNTE